MNLEELRTRRDLFITSYLHRIEFWVIFFCLSDLFLAGLHTLTVPLRVADLDNDEDGEAVIEIVLGRENDAEPLTLAVAVIEIVVGRENDAEPLTLAAAVIEIDAEPLTLCEIEEVAVARSVGEELRERDAVLLALTASVAVLG
eukprot:gene96-biopygen8866